MIMHSGFVMNQANYIIGFKDGVNSIRVKAAKKMLIEQSMDIDTIVDILSVKPEERADFIKSLKSILV